MSSKRTKAGNFLPMTVVEGITVDVLPHEQYEFLLSTSDVSIGYGVSEYAIRKTKIRHEEELTEGKHFVTAGTICPGDSKTPHNKLFFTKRGIIRLGFFIKSERAKLFRDWAEELIIQVDQVQRDLFHQPVKQKMLSGRNHNRLSPDRLIDILADVALIEQKDLRERLVNKLILKGGRV
jgi:hypothetical protein